MSLGLAITLILSVTQSVVAPTTAEATGSACPGTNYLPGTTGSYPDMFGNFASYLKTGGVYYKVNKITGEAMAVGLDSATVSNLVVPETITISSSIIQSAGFDSTSANCVAFVKEYKVRYIGEHAFETTSGGNRPVLSSVTINAQIKSIAPYAFANQCKVSSLVIPDSVTDIGESAFWFMNSSNANTNCSSGATGLQEITFGINLKRMAQQTFQADSNLTRINFRGPVFTTTNANNELDYPSSYDLFDFNNRFSNTRVQNTCVSMFPYVNATVSVLAGSSSGWTAWGTAGNCLGATYSETITTAPSKIATPVASNPTQSSAQVAFTAPFNGGSAITGYRVTSVPGGFTATLAGATADTVTVTGLSAATNYKFIVVAINANGDSSESELSNQITTLSLTAPDISLSSVTESATSNSAIAGYAISNTGGPVASYSISPPAGNGLSFNSSTGILTGTPLSAASAVVYTITGTNDAGSDTANFTITVAAAPTSSATPAATPAVYSLKLRITFSERSSKLTWAQKKKLRKAIAIAGPKVISGTVVGYVQRENYAANDKVLSAARAKSVAQFLSANGVKVRLVSMGKGALNSNKTSRKAVLNLRYSK
jgi:outer membrane protein OmpA-like peptidoglycan-associated protein